MEKNKIYIGCSGFYYPQWKGNFYPRKLPRTKWLEHYSSIFNTVELNGTFYRVPKLSDLKRQYMLTPDDFKFSVKMNRYITHTLKLKDSFTQIREFQSIINEGLSNKLHKFLFQMPPSFSFTEENLEIICENIPEGLENVIEFRHISWWNKKAELKLKAHNIVFCNVDFPGLKSYVVNSSKDFYMRFHGSPELFKSEYSENKLDLFYQQLSTFENYTIYFNNTFFDAAYKNAVYLKKLVKAANNSTEMPQLLERQIKLFS